jgi:hypothetical protein
MVPHHILVRRFSYTRNPEIYAGGSVAAGRASYTVQIKGQVSVKDGYHSGPGWRLCEIFFISHLKNPLVIISETEYAGRGLLRYVIVLPPSSGVLRDAGILPH